MKKYCSKCKDKKDLNMFQKYNGIYMSWCNQCKREENKLKARRRAQALW